MKLGELTSVGHNIASSLASGIGMMIGVYEIPDILGEAAASPEGYIEVDFLTGRITGGQPSKPLADAIALYAKALPALCRRHDVDYSSLRQMSARFSRGHLHPGFIVTVEDDQGRRATDEYHNVGNRVRVTDHLGRLRPKQPLRSR